MGVVSGGDISRLKPANLRRQIAADCDAARSRLAASGDAL